LAIEESPNFQYDMAMPKPDVTQCGIHVTIPEFIYAVLLRPKPLRKLANAFIRAALPSQIRRDGAIVILNPNDPVVSGALTLGVYENTETRFFKSVCKPGMTFLDVGANIGLYTALALPRIGSTGRVVALEPDRESFEYLRKTVNANHTDNVTCVRKAAADYSGVMKLFISETNRGDNRLYDNELSTGSYDVEVTTLDLLLKELEINAVDLVKIDVQGFEGRVLRGMRETIARSPNLTILMEFWPHGLQRAGTEPAELIAELKEMGLLVSELRSDGSLQLVEDHKALIDKYPGRQYTNLVAAKVSNIHRSVPHTPS
jgi:FkbM family methyltransferase